MHKPFCDIQPKFVSGAWGVPPESKLYTFCRYNTIPSKPDRFWLLKKGAVKTFTWSEEGTVTILGYWGAGDVIGQLLSGAKPYRPLCLTNVEALCVSHQWDQLLEAVYRSVQQTEKLLCILRTERMYQRLLKGLVWLAQKFGSSVKQGRIIELRLTHQELAELVGTTRVTVTRLLRQMEKEGLITRPRSYCIVLRKAAFAHFSPGDEIGRC